MKTKALGFSLLCMAGLVVSSLVQADPQSHLSPIKPNFRKMAHQPLVDTIFFSNFMTTSRRARKLGTRFSRSPTRPPQGS